MALTDSFYALVEWALEQPLAAFGALIGIALTCFVALLITLAARAAFATTRTGEHEDEDNFLK